MNYKSYKAILYQNGTASAPTVDVLENTLGVVPTWIYYSEGIYTADLGLGPLDDANVSCVSTRGSDCAGYWAWLGINKQTPTSSNEVALYSYTADPLPRQCELGGHITVEIKVYQ